MKFSCDLCEETELKPENRFRIRGRCESEIIPVFEKLSKTSVADCIFRRYFQLTKKAVRLIKDISLIEDGFENIAQYQNYDSLTCNLYTEENLTPQGRYLILGKGRFVLFSRVEKSLTSR